MTKVFFMEVKKLINDFYDSKLSKFLLNNYLQYLYVQMEIFDSILSHCGYEMEQYANERNKIMPKREMQLRILIAYCTKRLVILETGSIVFSEFDTLTKNILKMIYVDEKTWDCVQSELKISKSTMSRYRTKALNKILESLKRIGAVDSFEELFGYFNIEKEEKLFLLANERMQHKNFFADLNIYLDYESDIKRDVKKRHSDYKKRGKGVFLYEWLFDKYNIAEINEKCDFFNEDEEEEEDN